MLEACKKSDKILVIVKTNFGKIIGAYAPTTIKEGDKSVKITEGFTFYFDNGCVLTIRTSGTEPKIKWYSEIRQLDMTKYAHFKLKIITI